MSVVPIPRILSLLDESLQTQRHLLDELISYLVGVQQQPRTARQKKSRGTKRRTASKTGPWSEAAKEKRKKELVAELARMPKIIRKSDVPYQDVNKKGLWIARNVRGGRLKVNRDGTYTNLVRRAS